MKDNLNTSYVMVHLRWFIRHSSTTLFKYILCYGSSWSRYRRKIVIIAFKYILCYGSSLVTSLASIEYLNLNTSYVMVHLPDGRDTNADTKFKYILCYGSSDTCLDDGLYSANLNTSYVMVHPSVCSWP